MLKQGRKIYFFFQILIFTFTNAIIMMVTTIEMSTKEIDIGLKSMKETEILKLMLGLNTMLLLTILVHSDKLLRSLSLY